MSFSPQFFIMFYDAFAALISLPLSYMLRYDSVTHPVLYEKNTLIIYALAFVFKITAFRLFNISKAFWKYFGTKDFLRVFEALTSSSLALVLALFVLFRGTGLPRSVIFIDLVLSMAMLGGARFFYRAYVERRRSSKQETSRILLVGAGNAAAQLIRDANYNANNSLHIAAVFDDDPKTHGRSIQGLKVVGGTDQLGAYAERLGVNDVVIAIPSASALQIRRIVDLCARLKLRVKTLPALTDLIQGKVELSNIRPININDLLSRDPVHLNTDSLQSLLHDKSIMVTGAGGSIGSELCNQILRFAPKRIVLFESCEFFLYKTELKLKQLFPDLQILPVIGDVRDSARVESVLDKYRPDILFHAAAYKHVPMMEANPAEAVKTNVLGTAIVSSMANKYGVQRFVMVSTDKAVNPTNIMGATKRIAEMICLGENAKGPTHFSIIRFGNVLGSAGSVIPLFQEQIRNGGPVTVTHPEITRYFMSIPEATQLVLQACSLKGGGHIFVLEMGQPVKIADLARDLIRLSGYEEGKDIQISFTGLRPGEKLYEELLTDLESTQTTELEKIRVAKAQPNTPHFARQLDQLISSVNNEELLRQTLRELVPEYRKSDYEAQMSNEP